MEVILRRAIIYNVAWEDPRIDGQLLGLGPDDAVLMLTTGGCNVLDRLLDNPAHVVAVDLNPSQNALLEIRLAAARALTHDQFFRIFAESDRALFDEVYRTELRPLLSAPAAAFWDQHAAIFDSFFYSGAAGGLARVICALIRLLGLQPFVDALPGCASLAEQQALLVKHAPTVARVTRLFDFCLPAFAPFAGVPASQLNLVGNLAEGSIVGLFIDRVFRKTHIAADNYFYRAYLYGRYTRGCCPRYLRPEHFAKLKANASRVTVKTMLLGDAAALYPDGYFSAMILLDHMDWLTPQQVQQEWAVFSRKLSPISGRVLWRSFAPDQKVAQLKFLEYDAARVAHIERETPDRVGMYNSTYLARFPRNMAIVDAAAAAAAVAAAAPPSSQQQPRGSIEAAPLTAALLAALSSLPPVTWLLGFARALLGLAGAPPPAARVPRPLGCDEGCEALVGGGHFWRSLLAGTLLPLTEGWDGGRFLLTRTGALSAGGDAPRHRGRRVGRHWRRVGTALGRQLRHGRWWRWRWCGGRRPAGSPPGRPEPLRRREGAEWTAVNGPGGGLSKDGG